MRKMVALWVVPLLFAGCGGGSPAPAAKAPAVRKLSADALVIKAWTDAVRTGHYQRANAQFAIPSVIQNGSPPITLKSIDQVDAFNRSLPCGAVLLGTQQLGGNRTMATFRLTDLDGGRTCGGGVGHRARVSFLIDADHHIKEWIRIANGPPPGSTQA